MANRHFSLVTDFKGYRNREDITNMADGYLVYGSQNVVTTLSGKVGNRQGYTLDGQKNTTLSGIKSAFDCVLHTGEERNLRSWGSNIEFRFPTFTGTIQWNPIITSSSSANCNYTTFWNTIEQKDFILIANGQKQLYEWSGGSTYLASSTSNTITKTGTKSWSEEGFYDTGNLTESTIAFVSGSPATITDSANNFIADGFYPGQQIKVTGSASNNGTYTIAQVTAGTITLISGNVLTNEGAGSAVTIEAIRQVTINGNVYTYTGGETTTTLTGVTPSPAGEAVDSIVFQTPRTITDQVFTNLGLPQIDLIAINNNQLYVGALNNNTVYLSATDDYTNYNTSLPRLPAEGGFATLDQTPTGFVAFNGQMFASTHDLWYQSVFNQYTNTVYNSTDNVTVATTYETFSVQKIPTASLQGAQSQAYITNIRNNIAYISNEPTLNFLGFTQFQNGVQTSFYNNPTITNISDPIKFDFDAYDFRGGSVIYNKNFTYIAIPKNGIWRIYNHVQEWWEAPQTGNFSRFSIIDGEVYAHDNSVPQTYKLFDGYNDNNNPIDAVASFNYRNFGTRTEYKQFNEYFVEGYITGNTKLYCNLKYETPGCGSESQFTINGNDPKIVCLGANLNLLGKWNLGKQGLGSVLLPIQNGQNLPPKFRGKKTKMPAPDFLEIQETFYSNDIDQQWQILAFGPKAVISTNDTISIKF